MSPSSRQPKPILQLSRRLKASAAGLLFACQFGQAFAFEESVDFDKDIQPVFAKNCVSCHNEQIADGGLNLESFSGLSSGGDSGEVLDSNDPSSSLLLERITDDDDPMPPADNNVGAKRLSEDEIGRLSQWLEDGAIPPGMREMDTGAATENNAMQWSSLPDDLKPIYALAESPDGNFLAYGSGNNVLVRSLALGTLRSLQDETLDPSQFESANPPASQQAHLDLVQSIAIRPDGQQIASGGFGVVKLWAPDFERKTLLGRLSPQIRLAAFSPDGEHVACASGEKRVEIVNIAAGTIQTFLKSHRGTVNVIAWTPDGQSVLTCDDAGIANITQARTGSVRKVIDDPNLRIEQAICIDDETYLIRSTDGSVYRIVQSDNVATREVVPGVKNISHISRGTGETDRLYLTRADGELFELTTGSLETREVRTLPAGTVMSAVRDDGSRTVAFSGDGGVTLWSKESETPVAALDIDYNERRLIRHAESESKRQEAVLKLRETRLAAIEKISEAEIAAVAKAKPIVESARGAVEKQSMTAAQAELELSEAKSALAKVEAELEAVPADTEPTGGQKKLDAAKKLVATKKSAWEAAIKKHDASVIELKRVEAVLANASRGVASASEKLKHSQAKREQAEKTLVKLQAAVEATKMAATGTEPLVGVCFSSDSSVIVLVSKSGTLDAFAASDGRPLFSQDLSQTISGACVSSDRLLLLAGDGSASVESIRIQPNWRLAKSISLDRSQSPSRITALAYSPSGDQLVAGSGPASRSGDIKILDTATGEKRRDFGKVAEDTVLTCAYSPDGKQLLTGAADRLCRLYDIESGELVRTFEGHTHHVLSVAWRADGASFASGSADGTIKIWNAETGEQFRTITLEQEVASVQFVGSSGQVVSCSADGKGRLHNADDGKAVRTFSGPIDALYSVSVSPDEQFLSAAGQSGKIWRWSIESGKLSPFDPDPDKN